MKASGNGTPLQCVQNLLQIIRGECPMDRTKGISGEFYDMPRDEAAAGLIEDATWVIETYEPRINVNSIDLGVKEESDGSYTLTVNATNISE